MKVDIYTKAVLTVIAGCLLYLVARDAVLIKDALAQSRGPVEVNIVQIDNKPFVAFDVSSSKPALPVKVIQ